MLIGITGTLGAGKGAAVDYLVTQKNYRHVSARAIWTKELNERGLPIDRDTMTVFANEQRARHGAAYFMKVALATVSSESEKVVIESVRTVAEVEMLRSRGGILLAIDADIKERYKRISGRKSSLDKVSYDVFVRQEKDEMMNNDPNKQNISRVMQMADYKINNNRPLKLLREEVEFFLKKYSHD
jgi:dephospho-CoA kinase